MGGLQKSLIGSTMPHGDVFSAQCGTPGPCFDVLKAQCQVPLLVPEEGERPAASWECWECRRSCLALWTTAGNVGAPRHPRGILGTRDMQADARGWMRNRLGGGARGRAFSV